MVVGVMMVVECGTPLLLLGLLRLLLLLLLGFVLLRLLRLLLLLLLLTFFLLHLQHRPLTGAEKVQPDDPQQTHRGHLGDAQRPASRRHHARAEAGEDEAVQADGGDELARQRVRERPLRDHRRRHQAALFADALGDLRLAHLLLLVAGRVGVGREGDGDGDPVRPQLHLQHLGEAHQGELRGGVGGVAVQAEEAGQRGEEEDLAAAVSVALQRPQGRLHRGHRAEVVDVHHLAELGAARRLEGLRDGRAGAAGQRADRPAAVLRLGDDPLQGDARGGAVADVHRVGLDVLRGRRGAALDQRQLGALQVVAVARHQRHVGAPGEDQLRQLQADALRAAGDEDVPAGEAG